MRRPPRALRPAPRQRAFARTSPFSRNWPGSLRSSSQPGPSSPRRNAALAPTSAARQLPAATRDLVPTGRGRPSAARVDEVVPAHRAAALPAPAGAPARGEAARPQAQRAAAGKPDGHGATGRDVPARCDEPVAREQLERGVDRERLDDACSDRALSRAAARAGGRRGEATASAQALQARAAGSR